METEITLIEKFLNDNCDNINKDEDNDLSVNSSNNLIVYTASFFFFLIGKNILGLVAMHSWHIVQSKFCYEFIPGRNIGFTWSEICLSNIDWSVLMAYRLCRLFHAENL